MNILNPIEISFLAHEDHTSPEVNQIERSVGNLQRINQTLLLQQASLIRDRITDINNMMTMPSFVNIVFGILLWSGLFLGFTVSIYLTLVWNSHYGVMAFSPFLLLAAYFQVWYFVFGIYANQEKFSVVTSWFRSASLINIVGLSAVAILIVIDTLSRDASPENILYKRTMKQFSVIYLIAFPCEVLIVVFMAFQSTKHVLLLKEKERLIKRFRELSEFNSDIIMAH